MEKPKVLIIVHQGVAEYVTQGDVDVEMIDYDAVDDGDCPELSPEFAAVFPKENQDLVERINQVGAWEIAV